MGSLKVDKNGEIEVLGWILIPPWDLDTKGGWIDAPKKKLLGVDFISAVAELRRTERENKDDCQAVEV